MTLRTLRKMADSGEAFACLACYDFTMARWLGKAGIHVLLAGDSGAEMALGLPGTIHMPLDFAVRITAAVKRGAPGSVVMADMPFMSYQADDAEGVRNAGRFMTEGLADVVKVEVDASQAGLVSKMSRAGIPVCAHVGSLPQRAAMTGGYASRGRTAADAERIVRDAMAAEDAGAALLLVEATPEAVTREILERTSAPVIGIGAGQSCHGQILVAHDLLGLSDWQPGFAKPEASVGEQIAETAVKWREKVLRRESSEHRYEMREGEQDRFAARVRERGLSELTGEPTQDAADGPRER